jgi:hypothetical protein
VVTDVSEETISTIFRIKSLFELRVFFVCLFNDAVSISQYITSNDRSSNEQDMKGNGRGRI